MLAATWAAADYRPPLTEAVLALKFGGDLGLASGLGGLLGLALADQMASREPTVVDALVPIPLATARLAERGFNQAEAIAAALARHWPTEWPGARPPLRPAWLERARDTGHQSRLSGADRRANVDAGFLARGAAAGQRIGLVDDVMTTGATLDAAARALLGAGALAVTAFVVARTP